MNPKSPLTLLAEIAHLHPRLFGMAWSSLSVESKLLLNRPGDGAVQDDVQDQFRECTDNWFEKDGMERADYWRNVKNAWTISRESRHRHVAMSLANWLPTYTLSLEDLLALPAHLQVVLMDRKWKTKEVKSFIQHVATHPDAASERVAKAAGYYAVHK